MSPSSKNFEFQPLDRDSITDLWASRFGVPKEVFEGYSFYRRSRMVWIFSQDKIPPLRLETLGLRLMSLREDPWKPTTYALQLFGGYARKNKVDLSPDQARIFISGTSQEMIAEVDEGYVVVTFQGGVLGCGLCLHGLLVSQIPKERRMKDVIESDSINL